MISKEQYLQAKKTIADYELQEYLSGNSGLLKEPARGKTIVEEAKERGFVNGAIVETPAGSRFLLNSDPFMKDWATMVANATRVGTTNALDVTIWNREEGYLAKLCPKSPLQDAMDRGYRKGAVIRVGTENHILINDPVFTNGRIIAAVTDPFKEVWEATIWRDSVGYVAEMIKEAPENK